MALLVLDTSVVIAHLERDDPHHAAAVAAFAGRGADDLVLPATAYAEVLVGAYRRGGSWVTAVEHFVADGPIRIEAITRDIARQGAALRARFRSLSIADALVLGAGEVLDAKQVLTADRSWARCSRRVRVI